MKKYLISAAIGDIAGSAYEGRSHRIKDYDKVKMFSSRAHFTDDTVLTFSSAEDFIDHLEQINEVHSKILEQMESHGVKNIHLEQFSFSYAPAETVIQLVSRSFRAENKELYAS